MHPAGPLSCRFGTGAAALLNGAFGHSPDFDDTHADRYLHLTAPVIAAAGRLMGLTSEQVMSAFRVVASHASGSLQFPQNGAWNKQDQMGEAAMKGLIVATLAGERILGAADALEGRYGFLKGYRDGLMAERASSGLGSVWETRRIGVKPYPASRYTHAVVHRIFQMQQEHG